MQGRSDAEFGINLAGAEFGALEPGFSNRNPGRHGVDFRFPTQDCLAYFAKQGMGLIRLPVSWERLQPQPMGALNPDYTNKILQFLALAETHNCQVVLDLHNYGRYRQENVRGIHERVVSANKSGGREISALDLADLWVRVSGLVSDHPALHAYGLMNEPHDMGSGDWHSTSNQVVAALRANGDRNWIWVSGDAWSKAHRWDQDNPERPWVADALDRTAYEAHVYFDADSSGRYQRSFAEEKELDPEVGQRGVRRIAPFVGWCRRNMVTGVIGEYGIPWKEPEWLPVLDGFLLEIRRHRMTACAWAGGDMWGDYELSLEPRNGRNPSPLELILKHSRVKANN